MANTLYNLGREKFLNADINYSADTIKVALIDTGVYTFSQAHEFFDDVSAGQVGDSVTLTGKTSTSGVADADDVIFPDTAGATVEAVVMYKDTGVEATSPLIAYMDTIDGLPFTPNGASNGLIWDNGANKIFKL
jgi:hypothetical protein